MEMATTFVCLRVVMILSTAQEIGSFTMRANNDFFDFARYVRKCISCALVLYRTVL